MTFRLSPDALLDQRKALENTSDRHRAHLYSLQTQLGTWLVLGNAVALFTVGQAAFANHVQIDSWFVAACQRLIVGLGLAFIAMAGSYFLALRGMYLIANLAVQYLVLSDADRREEAAKANDSLEHLRHAQTHAIKAIETAPSMAKQMQFINVLVYGASGIIFVWGLFACLHLTLVRP